MYGVDPDGSAELTPTVRFDSLDLKRRYAGSYFTYEITRTAQGTDARVVGLDDAVHSKRHIDDNLHLMIHGCHFLGQQSPYVAVRWLLIRKDAVAKPAYGVWKSS